MHTKKIAFISLPGYHYYKPNNYNNVFGGAELQLYLISSELEKYNKYKISVLVADKMKEKREIINNTQVINIFNTDQCKSKFKQFYKLYKSLKDEKPDIIFKRGHGSSLIVIAIYKILHPKVKMIYYIANVLDINGERFKGFFGKLTFLAMKFVNTIIIQTQDQYNLLSKKDRKKVPNNGIIRNIYEYKENEKLKKPKYILWVSRCTEVKQPEKFLKLVKKFRNESFLMICPKVNVSFWNKIYKEANKLKNLTFIESVPFKEINKYFQNAKLFINTSTHEGYPNTFLQAAEVNIPILSLNVNPDNLLNKYKIGMDCKNNYSLMEEKLNILLKDKKIYNELSQNGKKYLIQEHSKDININKIIKILDNI